MSQSFMHQVGRLEEIRTKTAPSPLSPPASVTPTRHQSLGGRAHVANDGTLCTSFEEMVAYNRDLGR